MEHQETMLAGTRAMRYPIRMPIRYRVSGELQWREGRTENISRSGVLFRTEDTPATRTAIEMLLTLPPEISGSREQATVICRGRIVRTVAAHDGEPQSAVAATIAGYRLAHWQENDPRRI
jgi:hypothetical protein